MTSAEQATMTKAQRKELLQLMEGADSVELKLTVPSAQRREIGRALEIDPLGAQVRQVVFFDTQDLALNQHGVVVRARRVQGRGDDSVVKLRPVVPGELPGKLRKSPDFGVEVDAMPGGFVCSGSYTGTPANTDVKQVLAGERPIQKLFSKEQRAFFAEHTPEGLELNDLSILGPINTMRVKFSPSGFTRRLVAELWVYPDGSQIVELSTKCTPTEAVEVAEETKAFLLERGVDLGSKQETKTRTALDFFVRELRDGAKATTGGGG
jgi:hypothetical protein